MKIYLNLIFMVSTMAILFGQFAHATSVCGTDKNFVVWDKDKLVNDSGSHPNADICALPDEFYHKEYACPDNYSWDSSVSKCIKTSSKNRPECAIGTYRCSASGHDTCKSKDGCGGNYKKDLKCNDSDNYYYEDYGSGDIDYCFKKDSKEWHVDGDCKTGYFKSDYYDSTKSTGSDRYYLCTK